MSLSRKLVLPLLALLFILGGLLSRKVAPVPWVWAPAFLAFAVAFGLLAAWARRAAGKYAALVCMSLFFALAGAETMFALQWSPSLMQRADIDAIREDRNDATLQAYGSNRNRKHPVLGYAPEPDARRVASRLTHDGETVYDVTYTSGENGWRITPQHPDADVAVVFFGCSFTFGEGIEDSESYPYRVGEILGPGFQVFNFGFHGYGSHQMLAQIENGFLDDISKQYHKVIVYYPTIRSHELRSAGVSIWDSNGPWYELENGEPVYRGGFKKNKALKPSAVEKFFRESLVFQKIYGTKTRDTGPMQELHAAIIAKGAKLAQEKYGAGLYAVLWPGAPYQPLLEKHGVPVIDLAPVFPDWESAPKKYTIPFDGHPNALAANMAAKAIAAHAAAVTQAADAEE